MGENIIKRGYLIASHQTDKSPKFSQDSAKEDFILCQSCEQYFSVLETYISVRLHNRIWDIKHAHQFNTYKNQKGISWKVCEQINQKIFRLFIYSIIWRCNISSVKLCERFALTIGESETLRATLFSCKYSKQQELLNNLEKILPTFPTFPFLFITADSFNDLTNNLLFINPLVKNPYHFVLNEYMLIFSFSQNQDQANFDFLNNTDNSKIKIGYFPKEVWENLRTQIFQMIASSAAEDLQKRKQIPWSFK